MGIESIAQPIVVGNKVKGGVQNVVKQTGNIVNTIKKWKPDSNEIRKRFRKALRII